MLSEEICLFQFGNLLECIINLKHIDLACVSASMLGGLYKSPVLKLSEACQNKLQTIDLADGRHHKHALMLIKAKHQDKLKCLEDSLLKEEQKAKKTSAESEALELLEQKIEDEMLYIAGLGRWEVILYDAIEHSILCIFGQDLLTQNRSNASQ